MPELLNWIHSGCLWELGLQYYIGVFMFIAFKRKGEVIHPNVCTAASLHIPPRVLILLIIIK